MAPNEAGGTRLRISDVYEVPRRGYILRLKVVEGSPTMKDLKKGTRLRLEGPGGARTVIIKDYGVTSGRAKPARLERTGELDVLVSKEEAEAQGAPIGIGWMARPGGS